MSCTYQHQYKIITPNTDLPLTLEEVKLYCRKSADYTAEDDVFTMLICTAMKVFEHNTGRVLMKTSFETYRNVWNSNYEILRSPLVSIEEFKYKDSDNVEQIIDSSLYYILEQPFYSSVYMDCEFTYPTLYNKQPNSITIKFTAGYAEDESEVPCDIKDALLQYVCFLYQNRGDCACMGGNYMTDAAMAMSSAPTVFRTIVNQYKIYVV